MPKLKHKLTPERDTEVARRAVRAQTQRAELAAPATSYHTTEAKARRAAARCGLPNTEIGATQTPAGWVGVVYLRPDQGWMEPMVLRYGCLPHH
jgi:hypothetical protein